jgi:hypothetical protein
VVAVTVGLHRTRMGRRVIGAGVLLVAVAFFVAAEFFGLTVFGYLSPGQAGSFPTRDTPWLFSSPT